MLAGAKQIPGLLVLVAGPSGAGKDTLLDAARLAFENDPRFRFARRVITRPVETNGEQHAPASEAEFVSLRFALSWQAHGFRYGIPADIEYDLAAGRIVVANVSRTVIAEAAWRFPVIYVIEITAPPAIVAARLAERARESTSDIGARLARNIALPPGIPVETVMNDATIAEGAARIIAALTRVAEAALSARTDDPARPA
jgi:phosphonate metabolism protein PhnN/1,5-bisphosphokinase (PRPP-forming)